MRHLALLFACFPIMTACAGDTEPGTGREGDDTAGMGVPQQFTSEEFPGERQRLEVRTYVADDGCFLGVLTAADPTRRYLVVWPVDTALGSSGDEVRLPDGTVVRHGDVLSARGTLMPTRSLEGFGGDSYWDFAVGFCTPGASDVLVLDEVDPA